MFSDRLKDLREDNDLTQEKLSKELSITRSALGNYELGIREPSIELLIKLADFFNVSIDYLVCRTNDSKPFK